MDEERSRLMTFGSSHPLGATLCRDGANFSVFSKSGSSIELMLFADLVEEHQLDA